MREVFGCGMKERTILEIIGTQSVEIEMELLCA